MINMTRIACLLLLANSAVAASENTAPQDAAVEFNRWYLSQVNQNITPDYASNIMQKYVTTATLGKLRRVNEQERQSGEQLYDADFFIKSQYIGDDWSKNIAVLSADADPVCLSVQIAFGAKQDHVVADCMIKENGQWKIQSVTNIK